MTSHVRDVVVAPNLELVVLMGLQASGKTSFYKSRFSRTHLHVSKDLMRSSKNRERKQRLQIAQALQSGRSVVVDNTNPSVETRAPAIALAKEHGARVIGYYFESRFALSMERNAQRTGSARVPDVALRATAARLERPTRGEGFVELWYVAIEGNEFVVKEWTEES